MEGAIGVLFEQGSGKWLELIPQNARFHSDKSMATTVPREVFEDAVRRSQFLDRHNVDWYAASIVWQPVNPEFRA
ncbi:hypothetical protein GOB57_24825 [Sinorhizobium meliloti]|nr:hypothetical protein [Sinorhizobium meliloti]